MNLNRVNQGLFGVILGVLLSTSFQYVVAWTPAPAVPPGGTISAPLTTGNGTQQKAGGDLMLNGGGSLWAGGRVYTPMLCLGADCRSVWPTGGVADNLGDHSATMPLNMNNQKVANVANPTAAQDVATKSYVDSQVGGAVSHYSNLPSGSLAGYCFGGGPISGVSSVAAVLPGKRVGSVLSPSCSCETGWSVFRLSGSDPDYPSQGTFTCIKN